MIHLIDITKSFAGQTPLAGVNLHVRPRMKLALVGPNGAGKTTLLRIIDGDLEPDSGEVRSRKDLRLGFLPQEIESLSAAKVKEEVLGSFPSIIDHDDRLRRLGDDAERLSAGGNGPPCPGGAEDEDPLGSTLAEMEALQADFEQAGGPVREAQADTILRGMGFGEGDFERPVYELSGGWRMRVALARLLLERPDVLLLDEPTNHLDLESLLWLEEFLRDWEGALIVISHDRYFLNRLVTHVAELEDGSLHLYSGDYDAFEREKAKRREALENAARNRQREVESAERFVRRFRAKNTKAKQVQQKLKQLERMEPIELPRSAAPHIGFEFPQPGRLPRVVAEISGVRKSYGENLVYDGLELVVERGEKIALVGPNGGGKSTLLRLLAGAESPDLGSIGLGKGVAREYFAQHQLEVLSPLKTALDVMEEAAAPADRLGEVRSHLGAFLFSEDDVVKPVAVLSGGERARLALARMLFDPAGLLLLDEPTNHLDMASRRVLSEALQGFEGSLVFISHDRHLINQIATKVIEVREGRLTHYLGNWEYYRWKKEQEESAAQSREGEVLGAAGAHSSADHQEEVDGAGGSNDYEGRKAVRRRYRWVERRIVSLEERDHEIGRSLGDPELASDHEALTGLTEEREELRGELSTLYREWEELADAVAALGD